MYEKEYGENFEKDEEVIACDDKPKVEASKELEKGLEKLEDEDPNEVSIIETPIEKHLDEAIHDPFISHSNDTHRDDDPNIKKLIAPTST